MASSLFGAVFAGPLFPQRRCPSGPLGDPVPRAGAKVDLRRPSTDDGNVRQRQPLRHVAYGVLADQRNERLLEVAGGDALNVEDRDQHLEAFRLACNRSYETFAQFRSAILRFLSRTVPKKWDRFRDRTTDNFRIISPNDFRV